MAEDQPDLGKASGQVTLDGKPLPNANVFFQPVEGGRNSTGITDDQGNYILEYLRDSKGAKIGRHKVRVSRFVEPVKGDNGKIEDPGQKELVPDRYNQKTELEKDVKAGKNTINLELKTS
ncbi:carboxypeptidase-like regulatory domain-containing protein [uncultured Gimesia sp.]|uniref:carboxypeptidase-like regulatory domain-containing protein n=1 Tax=uncultured Gimesia sp. TaxID=1678688 RepID=UPI0030D93734